MSNAHPNQKHINKLISQLKAFIKKIDTAVPGMLKEFKLSFSKKPGDLSKLHNNVLDLLEHIHQEGEVIMQAVVTNKFYYIPNTVKHIAEVLWHVDEEVEKLSHKYKDNSLLQAAVKHFHTLTLELKKELNSIINASCNIINKFSRMPEEKYRDHTIGFRVNEDRMLKKIKSGAL